MAVKCWDCGEEGHIAAACPNLACVPPEDTRDAYREHMARIDHLVRSWQDGLLSLDDKRRAISAENEAFYGSDCPSRLRWHG